MIATSRMFRGCPTSILCTAIPGMPGRALVQVTVRRRVTAAELVREVNQAFADRRDCEGLSVDARALVPGEPDDDGCNWSPTALRLRVAQGPSTRALNGARQVVEWARLSFELVPPA